MGVNFVLYIYNTYPMKKQITEKQLQKIIKYISPEELTFQEDHWGKVPETYWERVDRWNNFLMHYFQEYKLDHFILAIILLEMQNYFNLYARIYDKKFEIIPICDDGATGLLKCLEMFDANFLNIESVSIKVRALHPLSIEDKPESFKDIVTRDSSVKNYKIEGKEVILKLFRIINENKDSFQEIAEGENRFDDDKFQLQKKNKPKTYMRKKFSPLIYKYLEEHLTTIKHDRLCYLGGLLLFELGIMPETQSDLSNNKKYKDYMRENFAKALPEDI